MKRIFVRPSPTGFVSSDEDSAIVDQAVSTGIIIHQPNIIQDNDKRVPVALKETLSAIAFTALMKGIRELYFTSPDMLNADYTVKGLFEPVTLYRLRLPDVK